MKPTKLISGAMTLICLSSAAQAQQPVNLIQTPGGCAGSWLSTFGGWLSVAQGAGCASTASSDVLEWTYTNGPTPFNGVYFTGYGSFTIELLDDGENVLKSYRFEAWGQDILVETPGYGGSPSGVRITRESGHGAFGISGLTGGGGPAQSGGGSGGGGPPSGGPPGGGPPGGGPPGGGPPGGGPPGGGPPGGGPPGGNGPNDEGNLNSLVNQPNATPEPATILLVATGLGGVGALARRRRNAEQRKPE